MICDSGVWSASWLARKYFSFIKDFESEEDDLSTVCLSEHPFCLCTKSKSFSTVVTLG